jgi:hypothetical protein
MNLKLSLALGGLLLWTSCGSSESDDVATEKEGPTAEEVIAEQKAIAEYYKISYKGRYTINKKTGKVDQLLLNNAPITDIGVDRIAKLTDLTTLNLVNTKITDQGLRHIGNLPNLRKLEIARNNITDAGVEYLMGLKKLEKLNLSYTRVADKGLMKLGELPSLSYLNLSRSRVTPRGRDKFEKTPTGRKAGFSLVN